MKTILITLAFSIASFTIGIFTAPYLSLSVFMSDEAQGVQCNIKATQDGGEWLIQSMTVEREPCEPIVGTYDCNNGCIYLGDNCREFELQP